MQILASVFSLGSVIFTVITLLWILYSVTFVHRFQCFLALLFYFLLLFLSGRTRIHPVSSMWLIQTLVCTCACVRVCVIIDIDVWFFFAFVPALFQTFSRIPPLCRVTHTQRHTHTCTHQPYLHLPTNGFGCLPWDEEAVIIVAVK